MGPSGGDGYADMVYNTPVKLWLVMVLGLLLLAACGEDEEPVLVRSTPTRSPTATAQPAAVQPTAAAATQSAVATTQSTAAAPTAVPGTQPTRNEGGPPMTVDAANNYVATMTTNHGAIVIELFPKEAPKTVHNFVTLSRDGFYDGVIFHRVIPNFMIQGGDPTGTGTGGPGYKFGDEFDSSLRFDKPGLLAMANSGPGTNGSQFFITTVPTPHLNDKHTIFGRVTDGQDVVEAISKVQSQRDKPSVDVVIQGVQIDESPGG